MNKVNLVYYWSPHINQQVATVKAVRNSILSIKKFGNKKYKPIIINVFGEWNNQKEDLNKKGIDFVDLLNLNIKLPINGFLKSRIFYILISLLSIPKLIFLIKKNKPNFVIGHLIVFPILFVSHFFKHNSCKFILRISGLPKLNLFRKYYWKLLSKNLYCITTPTYSTKLLMENKKIFGNKKILVLEDPIFIMKDIAVAKIKKQKYKNINEINIISVGRLTVQKNFGLLILGISKLYTKYPKLKLIILGSGEKKDELNKMIINQLPNDLVKIIPYSSNISHFYIKSEIFISTALWEDPGFAILEAAMHNLTILSSDCLNGPKEFLNENKRGYGFMNGNISEFIKNLDLVLSLKENDKENFNKKILAKKYCKKFTIFNHYKKLEKILF